MDVTLPRKSLFWRTFGATPTVSAAAAQCRCRCPAGALLELTDTLQLRKIVSPRLARLPNSLGEFHKINVRFLPVCAASALLRLG